MAQNEDNVERHVYLCEIDLLYLFEQTKQLLLITFFYILATLHLHKIYMSKKCGQTNNFCLNNKE
jgi:hypothetical protein